MQHTVTPQWLWVWDGCELQECQSNKWMNVFAVGHYSFPPQDHKSKTPQRWCCYFFGLFLRAGHFIGQKGNYFFCAKRARARARGLKMGGVEWQLMHPWAPSHKSSPKGVIVVWLPCNDAPMHSSFINFRGKGPTPEAVVTKSNEFAFGFTSNVCKPP